MQFIKSIFAISAFLAVSSAVAVERTEQVSITYSGSLSTFTTCDKQDLADCAAYCRTFEEKEICLATGDKVTCRCKPEKKSGEGCVNCLICLDQ